MNPFTTSQCVMCRAKLRSAAAVIKHQESACGKETKVVLIKHGAQYFTREMYEWRQLTFEEVTEIWAKSLEVSF